MHVDGRRCSESLEHTKLGTGFEADRDQTGNWGCKAESKHKVARQQVGGRRSEMHRQCNRVVASEPGVKVE